MTPERSFFCGQASEQVTELEMLHPLLGSASLSSILSAQTMHTDWRLTQDTASCAWLVC
jgi:hypothetical protein